MHNVTASLLLTKLNTGIHYVSLAEFTDGCEDALIDVRSEINELLEEGIIREDGDKRYAIAVDIYTLRKYILEGLSAEEPPVSEGKTCRFSRQEIMESVWHVRENGAGSDGGEEERENSRRLEELERRRRRLQEMRQDDADDADEDGEDDKTDEDDADEDGDPFADGELDTEDAEETDFSLSEYSGGDGEDEEEQRSKLLDLLMDEGRNAKLGTAAMKLCASEGYITPWLLCKNLHIDEETAGFICFWLYLNDYTQSDAKDDDKYRMAVPEELFYACCHEAEERKKAGRPAGYFKSENGQKKKGKGVHRQTAESEGFRKAVQEKLFNLLRTDMRMTRAKAIVKAEGCLCAVRELGDDAAAAAYEKLVSDLKAMSDYRFHQLKKQLMG